MCQLLIIRSFSSWLEQQLQLMHTMVWNCLHFFAQLSQRAPIVLYSVGPVADPLIGTRTVGLFAGYLRAGSVQNSQCPSTTLQVLAVVSLSPRWWRTLTAILGIASPAVQFYLHAFPILLLCLIRWNDNIRNRFYRSSSVAISEISRFPIFHCIVAESLLYGLLLQL